MKIGPVDSTKKMLEPQDIFAVAAYRDKEAIQAAQQAAKKAKMSPERLSYTIMLREYSDPRLIRLRAGNTLYTITALPKRIGLVREYNGDVDQNGAENFYQLMQAARKMGFDVLFAKTTNQMSRDVKEAVKKSDDPKVAAKFDSSIGFLVVRTGELRGD